MAALKAFFSKQNNLLINGTIIILILCLFYNSLLVHLNGNILACFGGIFQTDFLSNFPDDVYNSWNLRGIGYKIILYFFYKLYNFLFTEWDYTLFEKFTKFTYYVILFFLSYFFLVGLKPFFKKYNFNFIRVFLCAILLFLLATHRQSMEAEEIAVIITLGMFSFSISDNKNLNMLSGLFIPILFSLKAVTIVFAGFPFIAVLFFFKDDRTKIYRFLISGVTFTLLSIALWFIFLPGELADLKEATNYQSSFKFKVTTIPLLVFFGVKNLSCLSNLILPYLLIVVALFVALKSRNVRSISFIILTTILPSFYIIIQHRWFPYHYIIFLLTSFISIFYLSSVISKTILNRVITTGVIAACLIYFITNIIPAYKKILFMDPYCNNCNYNKTYYEEYNQKFSLMSEKYDLLSQPHILFLTSGKASYFIKTKSYLRQTYPLSLQRVDVNPAIKKTKSYHTALNRSLNYSGDYIIIDREWFNLEIIHTLDDKIKAEYELVEKYDEIELLVRNK